MNLTYTDKGKPIIINQELKDDKLPNLSTGLKVKVMKDPTSRKRDARSSVTK